MSSNKEVKVTIDVGAKFKGREQINESVQAVQALANVTGLAGKQILKMHKGLMSLEDAHKVLAHLNNTVGLNSTQIESFAQGVNKSSAEVQDFLDKNKDLTEEYERQCKRVERLENWTTNLSAKHKEQEKSLASLRKEYTKLGGDITNIAGDINNYRSYVSGMIDINKAKTLKIQEKSALEAKLNDVQKYKDDPKIIAELEGKKGLRSEIIKEKERIAKGLNPTSVITAQRRTNEKKDELNHARKQLNQLKVIDKSDIDTIEKYEEKVNKLNSEYKELKKASNKQKNISQAGYLDSMEKGLVNLNREIEELEAKSKGTLIEKESSRLKTLGEEIADLNNRYNTYNSLLPENYNELIKTGEAIGSLSEKHEKSEERIKRWDEKLKESTSAINEQGHTVDTAAAINDGYINKLHGEIEAQTDLEESTDKLKESTEELKNEQGNSSESSSKLDKSTSSLGNSMLEAAIKYKLLTKALDIGKKLYQECAKTLEDVGRVAINTGESLVNGFGQAIETAEKLIDIAGKACSKIKELADAGSDLQAGWFKMYNYLGEEGGNTYNDYLNELYDVLNVDTDFIVQNAEGVLSMVDNLGLSLEKSTEAMEAFTHFGLDLATFSGEGFGEIVGQLENAVNLNVLNSRSALAHALNLTDKDIEVFKSFNSEQERANYLLSRGGEFRDNYKKWLQTAGGKITQLNNSVSNLTANIQRLSTGLLAKLAPAITSIIRLLDKLVSLLYKVFNITDLTSAEGNMAKGFDGVIGDAESATEALDDTTEAAKKLERQVAGFDDVIQINDSSSSDKDKEDTVNGLMGDIDFSDWLEELTPNPSAFEKKLDELYDMIGKGKWAEVGNKVRDLIVNGLNSIDWSKVKNKLAKFTRGLSNLLNGLLEKGKLAGSIGASLSQLINTVVAGINAFLGNKELFKNLGISLSKGLSSFFETLDAEGIANMLSSFVRDVFTTFSNFVDTMNKDGTWSLIGTKISAIINGFFSSFTTEDVQNGVDSIISFINGVFEMIGTFIDNLDTEDIKNKITTFVRGLFEGFKEHQDEWAATLSEFTSFIVDLLSSLVETWDSTGMTNAVIKFLQDSGIYDMVWTLVKLKLHMLFQGILIKIASVGPMLQEAVGTIIALIIARISIGIATILGLGERIKTGIETLGTWLKIGLSEIWDWIKDLFSNIFDWVGDWVSKLWDKVSGFFDSLKDKILGVDETVSSAESHSSGGRSHSGGGYYRNENGFISGYSAEGIEVPLLANGGIVHRATLATIGEAGTEAVVPLQNNTEWMDTMAKSLVSAMDNKNNGMTGNTVVIDMSKCSKQVYTRSELQAFGKLVADSLNTYGANVAYNY